MPSVFLRSLSIALVCATAGLSQTWTFQVNGVERTALVYAPKDLGTNRPLFISMHGMSGDAAMQKMMAKVEPIADTAKFLLVYPTGLDKKWDISGTTDLDFLLKIIDSTAAVYGIDRGRVYASGFSMGGMMSYYFACKHPDKVAAIGPAAGYPLGGQYGCVKGRAVPILHVQGDLDTIVASTGLRPFLVKKATEYGCPTTTDTTRPYPVTKASSKVTKEHWGPCDKNGQKSEITLLTVAGMSHNYTTGPDINTSQEVWNFAKGYSIGQSGVQTRSVRGPAKVWATYGGGTLRIGADQGLRGVSVRDTRGRVVASWQAEGQSASTLALPLTSNAGGLMALEVETAQGRTGALVVAP